MKFTLFNIGKTEGQYLNESITDYYNRIQKFIPFEIIDIPAVKFSNKLSVELVKEKEAEQFLKYLKKMDCIVLLDEQGKEFTSREFSGKISGFMQTGIKNVGFVTGGAFGFSQNIYQLAHEKMRLSKMTFTHQMVRLIFVEQLYRACSIIYGLPYHND